MKSLSNLTGEPKQVYADNGFISDDGEKLYFHLKNHREIRYMAWSYFLSSQCIGKRHIQRQKQKLRHQIKEHYPTGAVNFD